MMEGSTPSIHYESMRLVKGTRGHVSMETQFCYILVITATTCFHLFWRQSICLLIISDCLWRQCLTHLFAKRWCVSHQPKWAFQICWNPRFSSKVDLANQLISPSWTIIHRGALLRKQVPKEVRFRQVTKYFRIQTRSWWLLTILIHKVRRVHSILKRTFCLLGRWSIERLELYLGGNRSPREVLNWRTQSFTIGN